MRRRPAPPDPTGFSKATNVRGAIANAGAYDGKIRAFDFVSYPERKGGNNGLTIYTIQFDQLPPGARSLIEDIRKGNDAARRGDPGAYSHASYDNARVSAAYGGFHDHLPAGGSYKEYKFQDPSLADPGAPRLIWDQTHDNFYVTLTHYRVARQDSLETSPLDERRNPFYRVKDIPFAKRAEGGGPRALKNRSTLEQAGLGGPSTPVAPAAPGEDLIKFD